MKMAKDKHSRVKLVENIISGCTLFHFHKMLMWEDVSLRTR